MTNEQILTVNEAAGVLLSEELLRQIGVEQGDQIEVSIVGRTLIVRSLEEADRARKIAAATRDIFDRRREAYLELAKGPQ